MTTPTPLMSSMISMQGFNDDDVNITMQCEGYWFSCRGRCTKKRELGGTEERLQCFCDANCELFQDCCADFDLYCSSSEIPAQERPNEWPWKCVEDHYLSKFLGVWMISSCPRNWILADTRERCGKFTGLSYYSRKDSLPVIDQKGNTYKNHYCAHCHGIALSELTFYNVQFKCDLPVPKNYERNEILKFLFAYCSKYFWKPPEGAVRRYCHKILPTYICLNWPPTKVKQKCHDVPARLVYAEDSQNYLNPYCAFCSLKQNVTCGPGKSKSGIWDPQPAKPFSLVMDLDFVDEDTENLKLIKHEVCFDGYVYDFFLQVCRPAITPSDIISRHFKIFSVSIWMRFMVQSRWPVVNEMNFKEGIANKLQINESQIWDLYIENRFGPVSTAAFNINISPHFKKNLSTKTLQMELNNLTMVFYDVNLTFFKVAVKPFHCTIIHTYHPNEYKFERNTVQITDTGEVFQEADFYANETEWINGSLVPIGVLSVCKQPPMNCSGVLVRLTENEYIMLSNGSIYRNISRELFQPGTFQFMNDTISVCAIFSRSTDDNVALVVLTYMGLSLSILCFVLVLVTYTMFKELRTLPGIYIMNLCLAHLLADGFYFATGHVEAEVACKIIAVLLHYFFLVSFMWMSIIAFDTWHVFSKIRVQHKNRNKRERCSTLLRRIALGWLGPFIFILVCVALDQSNAVVFQYGGVKGCWINNTYANLFFFVLPVALSLSVNSVFFALTVRAIRQINNQTRRVAHQTRQNHQTTAVFLKIFILMGFTWIFGFLQDLVSQYFAYPFIIFTTLQGLYVALAFVFTARVKQMYRMLLSKSNSVTENKTTAKPKRGLAGPVVLLSYLTQNED